MQCMKTHLVTVRSRGTVTLTADFRRRLHLDRAYAQVKLIEHEEMTWSFSGPDGRATFEWVRVDGDRPFDGDASPATRSSGAP